MSYKTIEHCRSCGSPSLEPILSLGNQYISDFVTSDKIHSGNKCPIDLVWCTYCTLLQQKHTAPQDFMYSRYYWYRSGVTHTMREGLRDVTKSIEQTIDLNQEDVVLDIGSNDGTLLRSYSKPVFKVGVEPAINLLEEGSKGVDLFIGDFWSEEAYNKAMSEYDHSQPKFRPRVITACGMFYDLENPNQFISDISKVLHEDGLFVAQLMCLYQNIKSNDVGNFAHEHLEFYSLYSLDYLLGQHDLEIFDVEENSINGGSYRLFIRHKGSKLNRFGAKDRLELAKYNELFRGLYRTKELLEWSKSISKNRERCRDLLFNNPYTWVYGASTKGNVILQWLGVGDKDGPNIAAAADKSLEKHGLYTVGSGIRITSEEEFRSSGFKTALVLPYAFIDEFVSREYEWRSRGGKFIVPFPEVRVV